MEDPKTQQLKANYNQLVLSVARNVYLKHQECVRDLNESKIREEERYDKYRTTTIEEVARQLEAHRKSNAPIDFWV